MMQSTQAHKTKRHGPMPIMMHLALMALSQENMQHILQGIHNYHHHDFYRGDDLPPLESVWTSGASRLLKAPATSAQKQPIPMLLIPSFINGAEIFDLTAERSFIRWLAAQGFDCYLFDWGALTEETEIQSLDRLINGKLSAALSFISDAHQSPAHILGYCLGGNLALALATVQPEKVKSLTLLATPWDFHHRDNTLRPLLLNSDKMVRALADKNAALSTSYLQSLFIQTNIMQSAEKYANFGQHDPHSPIAKHFVATEDWVNGGADIPAELIAECIRVFYKDNAASKGHWTLNPQHIVSAAALTCPCLIIAPRNDSIVPYATSMALAAQIPSAKVIAPESGHIGMLVGRKAQDICWQPIFYFIAAQQ